MTQDFEVHVLPLQMGQNFLGVGLNLAGMVQNSREASYVVVEETLDYVGFLWILVEEMLDCVGSLCVLVEEMLDCVGSL